MNYRETLEFLYSQLPMFQRIGPAAFKKDLSNILALCHHLGHPQHAFKSIHVAGTNGKGSVSHILSAIYQKAGYKTGIYSSPHLKDFRERIKINGELCEEGFVTDFVNSNLNFIQKIQPSFFEITVAMAFHYFYKSKVDIAIIETGLGGRLDSTNIIEPHISVITNIGMDHQQFLGNSLEEIAVEKGGIIKENIPVIIGRNQAETRKIFIETAREKHSDCLFADQLIKISEIERDHHHIQAEMMETPFGFKEITLGSGAVYQLENTATALATVLKMNEISDFKVLDESILEALENFQEIAGFKGRWQVLSKEPPLIIADAAHNEDGIRNSVSELGSLKYDRLLMVIGTVNDKQASSILKYLPKEATYYFCRPDIPRGKDAAELKREAAAAGLQGNDYSSVSEAFKMAKIDAVPDDLIYVGGSIFVVAEVV